MDRPGIRQPVGPSLIRRRSQVIITRRRRSQVVITKDRISVLSYAHVGGSISIESLYFLSILDPATDFLQNFCIYIGIVWKVAQTD
jgi:hypothetical protein